MRALLIALLVLLTGCVSGSPERIVERQVEVTRLATVEVTRIVEATRLVPVEVTREVEITVLVPAVVNAASTVVATQRPTADSGDCYTWEEAGAHVGEVACVEGLVTDTYDSGRAFFINFDSTRQSFYGVAFDYTFPEVEGTCVRISGTIETYNGRPQIIIRNPDQITAC